MPGDQARIIEIPSIIQVRSISYPTYLVCPRASTRVGRGDSQDYIDLRLTSKKRLKLIPIGEEDSVLMIEAVEMCGEFKGMNEMFMSIIDSIASLNIRFQKIRNGKRGYLKSYYHVSFLSFPTYKIPQGSSIFFLLDRTALAYLPT